MKKNSSLKMTKMSGAGNTFVLVDARKESAFLKIEKSLNLTRPQITKIICDKVFGLSTDGALFIEDGANNFDFHWDFFNSDGSTAEMCGNAARCAAVFCVEELEVHLSQIKFKTGAGLVSTELHGNKVKVTMPEAKVLKEIIELKTHNDATETFSFVNTGVPHLVQKIHQISDTSEMKDMAREARSHKDLGSAGANVTFYVENSLGNIEAVTFERGVEDYTLACGTGAVAAALVYSKHSGQNKINVQMPGGLLEVQFTPGNPHPLMTGEAVIIGNFEYNLEELK